MKRKSCKQRILEFFKKKNKRTSLEIAKRPDIVLSFRQRVQEPREEGHVIECETKYVKGQKQAVWVYGGIV